MTKDNFFRIWLLISLGFVCAAFTACKDDETIVESISLNKSTMELSIGEFETLVASVLPTDATDKTVTWSSKNANATVDATGKVTAIAAGTAVITAQAGGKSATCTVTIIDPALLNDAGAVINGVRWATRNVDAVGTFAATAESSGMYFQWNRKKAWSGKVNTSIVISTWDATISDGMKWEKTNDPSPVGWRIPTPAEIESLLDETKVTRAWDATQKGYTFTDKTTNASIFLYAAGYISSDLRIPDNEYIRGYYWSNTRADDSSAYGLLFGNNPYAVSSTHGCKNGRSIRCVAE